MQAPNAAPGPTILHYQYLDISTNPRLSSAFIDQVNAACDRLEDAGPCAILAIRFNDAPALNALPASDEPITTALINKWETALRRLERGAFASICLLDGALRGYGTALLLATDFRIATVRSGLTLCDGDGAVTPHLALHRLVNQVGAARSRSMCLFGETIGASEAGTMGLLDVVDDDIGFAQARLTSTWTAALLQDLRIRRGLLHEASAATIEQALGAHLAACDRTLRRRG